MGGSKGLGGGDPIQESAPVASPNELNHADNLTEVYGIAYCRCKFVSSQLHVTPSASVAPSLPPVLVFLEPPLKVH